MKTKFCQVSSKTEAFIECPWAAEAVEVDGGFMCFESIDDYNTWANQQ